MTPTMQAQQMITEAVNLLWAAFILVVNAIPRCENCGCPMSLGERVCKRCGWDNWEHKEA